MGLSGVETLLGLLKQQVTHSIAAAKVWEHRRQLRQQHVSPDRAAAVDGMVAAAGASRLPLWYTVTALGPEGLRQLARRLGLVPHATASANDSELQDQVFEALLQQALDRQATGVEEVTEHAPATSRVPVQAPALRSPAVASSVSVPSASPRAQQDVDRRIVADNEATGSGGGALTGVGARDGAGVGDGDSSGGIADSGVRGGGMSPRQLFDKPPKTPSAQGNMAKMPVLLQPGSLFHRTYAHASRLGVRNAEFARLFAAAAARVGDVNGPGEQRCVFVCMCV